MQPSSEDSALTEKEASNIQAPMEGVEEEEETKPTSEEDINQRGRCLKLHPQYCQIKLQIKHQIKHQILSEYLRRGDGRNGYESKENHEIYDPHLTHDVSFKSH